MYTFHSGGGWWDVGDCLEYCLKMTSIFLIQDNYEEDCNSVGRWLLMWDCAYLNLQERPVCFLSSVCTKDKLLVWPLFFLFLEAAGKCLVGDMSSMLPHGSGTSLLSYMQVFCCQLLDNISHFFFFNDFFLKTWYWAVIENGWQYQHFTALCAIVHKVCLFFQRLMKIALVGVVVPLGRGKEMLEFWLEVIILIEVLCTGTDSTIHRWRGCLTMYN